MKKQGQGHGWGQSSKSQCESNILSTHIPFITCQSGNPLLSHNFFKIWPWKSKVKVMGEVTVQSVGLASYRLTSLLFHVNRPSHSWDTAFSNLTLKIKGQGHGWGHRSKSQCGSNILIDSHPFCSMSIGHPIPEIQHFQNLTLKIKGQGQMTLMLHNYRSRQFHRTSNGINPSSGFKDTGSAKSGPSAAWFDKFLAHGQTHMGQMGK